MTTAAHLALVLPGVFGFNFAEQVRKHMPWTLTETLNQQNGEHSFVKAAVEAAIPKIGLAELFGLEGTANHINRTFCRRVNIGQVFREGSATPENIYVGEFYPESVQNLPAKSILMVVNVSAPGQYMGGQFKVDDEMFALDAKDRNISALFISPKTKLEVEPVTAGMMELLVTNIVINRS